MVDDLITQLTRYPMNLHEHFMAKPGTVHECGCIEGLTRDGRTVLASGQIVIELADMPMAHYHGWRAHCLGGPGLVVVTRAAR